MQESNYLISKAPRHRSTIIPPRADEMPLTIMSITAVMCNLEVICFMNLDLYVRILDGNVHISTYLVTRQPLKSRLSASLFIGELQVDRLVKPPLTSVANVPLCI